MIVVLLLVVKSQCFLNVLEDLFQVIGDLNTVKMPMF